MPGKTQVALAGTHDFVQHRGREAHAAKTAGGDVVAVVDEGCHGFGNAHTFIGHGARFLAEELPGGVDIRRLEQLTDQLYFPFHFHHAHLGSVSWQNNVYYFYNFSKESQKL